MIERSLKALVTTLMAGGLVGVASSVQAAGYAIIQNSASGTGSSFAGAAAIAEDASTVWFNPAGMGKLGNGTHVSVAGHVIAPTIEFEDKGSWINPSLVGGNVSAAIQTLDGTSKDLDKVAMIPNAYATRRINDRLSVGVGLNVPYGLGVTYENDWIGRYNAIESSIQTVNINPSVAYEINEQLTFGVGLNAQYMKVNLSSAIDSAAACRSMAGGANSGNLLKTCLDTLPVLANQSSDSHAMISGDDLAYGYNVGVIYQPAPPTKIGISYRSPIKHKLDGTVDYTVNPTLQGIISATGMPILADAKVTANNNTPAMTSMSITRKLGDKVELMTDVTTTAWSSFNRLTVKNAETGAIVTDANQSWKDVKRYSLGGSYQYNNQLKLRGGVALDKAPVPSTKLRSARSPDTDRTWVSVGANYQFNKAMSFDVGYARLFMDQMPVDNTNEDNGYAVRGLYDNSVNIVSAQINWSF